MITIDRDGVTERVSANRCVYAPPPANERRASTTNPGDLADKVTEGTQYAVERLLKRCVMEDGPIEFLIKWADYDAPTWTARTHIPEELVSRYSQRRQTRTGRDLSSEVNAGVHPEGGGPQPLRCAKLALAVRIKYGRTGVANTGRQKKSRVGKSVWTKKPSHATHTGHTVRTAGGDPPRVNNETRAE